MAALFELAGELTLIALFLLCYLTLQGYRFSFRPLLLGIGWLLRHFAVALPIIGSVGPGPWLDRQVHQLDNTILTYLAAGIDASEQWMAALWNGSASLMQFIAVELEGLARDTATAVEHLGSSALDRLKRVVEGLVAAALVAGRRALADLLHRLLHGASALIKALLHRVVALEQELVHWRGFTARQLRAYLRRLARYAWVAGVTSIAALGHSVFGRLHLKWLIGYRTLAALGLGVLSAVGISWTRCDNTTKHGKNLCGMDPDLLDALLLDSLAIIGPQSIVEFTRELLNLFIFFVGLFEGFIRELRVAQIDYLGHVDPVVDLGNILDFTIPADYLGPV